MGSLYEKEIEAQKKKLAAIDKKLDSMNWFYKTCYVILLSVGPIALIANGITQKISNDLIKDIASNTAKDLNIDSFSASAIAFNTGDDIIIDILGQDVNKMDVIAESCVSKNTFYAKYPELIDLAYGQEVNSIKGLTDTELKAIVKLIKETDFNLKAEMDNQAKCDYYQLTGKNYNEVRTQYNDIVKSENFCKENVEVIKNFVTSLNLVPKKQVKNEHAIVDYAKTLDNAKEL